MKDTRFEELTAALEYAGIPHDAARGAEADTVFIGNEEIYFAHTGCVGITWEPSDDPEEQVPLGLTPMDRLRGVLQKCRVPYKVGVVVWADRGPDTSIELGRTFLGFDDKGEFTLIAVSDIYEPYVSEVR